MSYHSGRLHLSERSLRDHVEIVFEVPVSLGIVATLEQQTGEAFALAHHGRVSWLVRPR